jgi:hypothetical protein
LVLATVSPEFKTGQSTYLHLKAGLSSLRPRFMPGPVQVGFVMEIVVLGQVYF